MVWVISLTFVQTYRGARAINAPEEMPLRMQARVPVSSRRTGTFLAGPDGPARPNAAAPTVAGEKRNPGKHRPVSAGAGRVVAFRGSSRSPFAGARQRHTPASGFPSEENQGNWWHCRPSGWRTPREVLRMPAAVALCVAKVIDVKSAIPEQLP